MTRVDHAAPASVVSWPDDVVSLISNVSVYFTYVWMILA